MRFVKFAAAGVGCLVMAAATTAQAEPILQLYLEGGTYSDVTESWELTASLPGESFRVWAIGNVAGPGGKGAISDVRLSIAYEAVADVADTPVFGVTPSTTGDFGGFLDPSVPAGTGTWIQTVTNGDSPTLGDGSSLPAHGIYGSGTDWQEFALGDFTLTDSPIADFINAFPSAPVSTTGQINVYEISLLSGSALPLHIDLYDTILASNHAKFAPFSHDAGVVPAPGAALLAFIGLGLVGFVRRRNP